MTAVSAPLTITNTVTNQDNGSTNVPFKVGLYLSQDNVITTDDILLGSRTVTSLAAGASSSADTSVTIPSNVPAGNYFIGAIADYAEEQSENNETNNARSTSGTIQVN
jgi:subtilase family serine protease